jgi:hypothetical protein
MQYRRDLLLPGNFLVQGGSQGSYTPSFPEEVRSPCTCACTAQATHIKSTTPPVNAL